MKKCFITILFFLLTIKCSQVPLFKFKEPQPPDLNDLPYIPAQYLGKYVSTKDSSTITITPKLIIQEWIEFTEIEKNKLNEISDTAYEDDALIKLGHNWTLKVSIKNDSVNLSTYQIDTLFQMSDNTILRSFKGQLFVNEKQGKYWSVNILILKNNKLEIGILPNETNLMFLETIPEQSFFIDSITNFKPSIKRRVKPGEIKKVKTNSQFFNRI